MEYIIIGILLVVIIGFVIWFVVKNRKPDEPIGTEIKVNKEQIELLAEYAAAKKREDETKKQEELRVLEQKRERKDLLKHQMETFKQTKEQLKEKLKSQINKKEWRPLEAVLKSADKGEMGIYILYNASKDKYYVGQAKQIFKRIQDHFKVESIARDFLSGDRIQVKFLTANELSATELDVSYRIDHIEKIGIELLNSDKDGYNKTTGNL